MIKVHFKEDQTAPELVLYLPRSMEGTEGALTLTSLGSVFDDALMVAQRKSFTYGDAWRRQGWMGNLARIMSKVARLKVMCWRDHSLENSEESVTDSAIDLVNITGFFIVNRSEENKWGTR